MPKTLIKDDNAPLRARRDDKIEGYAFVGRTVLVNRPRTELFSFWQDFSNLPFFMDNLKSIEPTGAGKWRWHIKAPLGQTVTVETETGEVVADETIGWRSTEDSQVKTTGRVTFADAPTGRGTVVALEIAYEPPGGDLGRLVAKLFAREPNIQARHELKRFKMLMEAGEIAYGPNRREENP
jgi:uncharacterized membrane protein